eukprot:scaffold326_cov169-Ochromonas_danica.AAC.12
MRFPSWSVRRSTKSEHQAPLNAILLMKLLDEDNFRLRMEAIIPIPSVADYVITSAIRLLDSGHHLKVTTRGFLLIDEETLSLSPAFQFIKQKLQKPDENERIYWGIEVPTCSFEILVERNLLKFLETNRYISSIKLAESFYKTHALLAGPMGSSLSQNSIVRYVLDIDSHLLPMEKESRLSLQAHESIDSNPSDVQVGQSWTMWCDDDSEELPALPPVSAATKERVECSMSAHCGTDEDWEIVTPAASTSSNPVGEPRSHPPKTHFDVDSTNGSSLPQSLDHSKDESKNNDDEKEPKTSDIASSVDASTQSGLQQSNDEATVDSMMSRVEIDFNKLEEKKRVKRLFCCRRRG